MFTQNQGLLCLVLCLWADSQDAWEGAQPEQLTQSGQIDIPYHRVWCPIYKSGELARRCWLLLWDRLDTGQQEVSNCNGHHLSFLGFISPSLLLTTTIIAITVILLYLIYYTALMSAFRFYLFLILFPIPFGPCVGESERAAAEYLAVHWFWTTTVLETE